MLQIKRNVINTTGELLNKIKGDAKQQAQDIIKAKVATFFTPKRFEIRPLIMQEKLPAAMMKNDKRGMLNCAFGL